MLLLVLLVSACRKDLNELTIEKEEFSPPTIKIEDPINASVLGVVVDEVDNAVAGATVIMLGRRTTTNLLGQFVFANVTMDESGTFIKIQKEGFFDGATRFFPKEDSKNYVKIKLLTKIVVGSFLASSGGTVSSQEGIQLNFEPNSIIKAEGGLYSGNVNVAARWIDPAANDLYETMPGNLQGIDEFGNEVALATYGMMAVELTSDQGEKLNVGNNKQAELVFPIPPSLLNDAPIEIPLWYYDDGTGLWKQEGVAALLQGGNYIGKVSHFSFWNCDEPFPLVELKGRVVTTNGLPLNDAQIALQLISNSNCGFGRTDNDGYFLGKVPAGEVMQMTVFHNDLCELYSTTIGSFTTNADMGDIVINNPDLIEVLGSVVDCGGATLKSGSVQIILGSRTYHYLLDGDGNFNAILRNCEMSSSLKIKAVDFSTVDHSGDILYFINNSTIDAGSMAACGNNLEEYIKLTVDGESFVYSTVSGNLRKASIGDVDSVFISGSSSSGFNAHIGLPVLPLGSYTDQTILGYFSFHAYFPSNASFGIECGPESFGSAADCNVTEIVIMEFNQIDGKIKGRFIGEEIFYDVVGSSHGPFEFLVEFSANLD